MSNAVTIDFLTNTIMGDVPDGVGLADQTEIGPAVLFADVPAKNVSIRQFESFDQTAALQQIVTGQSTHRYIINDTVSATSATIRWDARGSATLIEEISYLFVGEVIDGPNLQPGNGGNGNTDPGNGPDLPILPGQTGVAKEETSGKEDERIE